MPSPRPRRSSRRIFLIRGVNLVGGGGLLRGLAQRLSRETKVPVELVDAPLECVVLGAGHCLGHYDALKGTLMGARRTAGGPGPRPPI